MFASRASIESIGMEGSGGDTASERDDKGGERWLWGNEICSGEREGVN